MPGPVLYAELQRAEEALQEQKGLYETLLQVQSDLGECVMISDGNQIEYVNDAAVRLFGYSREELLALPSFLELVVPDERDLVIQRLQKRFLGEAKDEHHEIHIRRRDGKEILVEMAAKAVQLPNGIRIVALLQDVTERRQLESAIRQSEETFRTLFDTSTAGIAQIDPEGRFLRSNAALQQLLGYSADELASRSLGVLTHPEDLPRHEEAFRRFQTGETGAVLEKRMIRKDGAAVWVRNSLSLVRDAHGKPLHGIVITIDITAQKELAESHARFTSIVQSSSDGMASASPEGSVRTWNPAMERITGYRAEEALGKNFQRFSPSDQHADQLERFSRVLRGEGVVSYRTERLRKDGSRFPAHVTMTPIRSSGGEITGVSAIVRDITEELRREQEQLRAIGSESARTAAEKERERFAFLAEAGKSLAASLDLPSRLNNVAQLSVPTLADVCIVHLQDEKGAIRSVAVAHRDRAKIALAERVARRFPIDPSAPAGVAAVIRSGQTELVARVTDETLQRAAAGADHLRTLRELGPKTSLVVPLVGRARTIGAISFAITESDRPFSSDDVLLAEQFAQRAALAVENALLYDQRRRAEESLRRLASIVEASEDGIVSATLDGTVISWNGGAERMFGYSAAEILGKSWTMIVPMEREGEVAGSLTRLRAGEHIEHFESERISRDGRRVDVSVAMSPLRDADGALIGVSSIMRDITERARYEEAIRASQSQLEERVWALQALHELAEAISNAGNLPDLLSGAMAILRDALKADRTAVLTYDDQGVMRFRAWHNLSDAYRKAVEGHSPWRRDDPEPSPVLVPYADGEPSLAPHRATLQAEGIRSLGFIPLVHERRLLGKFMVYFDQPHEFTPAETRLLGTVAKTVAFSFVRRANEEDLRQKERLLSDFFENSTIGLHWVGPDGVIVWANPAELRNLGYGPQEYVGHPITKFHADPKVIEDILQALKRGETIQGRPARMLAKDGSVRHVVIDSSGYFEDGRFVHSRCFTRDVTKQVHAESALRESEGRLALVNEMANDAIFTADREGRITYVNEAACAMFGTPRPQLVGSPIERLIAPAAREKAREAIGRASAKDEFRQRRFVAEAVRADGVEFPVEMNVSRVAPGGTPVLVAHVRDVSDRVRAERLQSQLQAIVQSSHDAIITTTLDGIITGWNVQAHALYGYQPAEVEGRSLGILAPRDRRNEWRDFMARIRAGEAVDGLETVRIRKDGSAAAVRIRVTPLLGATGEVSGAAIFAQDVTEAREKDAQVTLFRSIFDWSLDGIAVIDPQGHYIVQNESHRRMVGYSDEELRGKTPALHLGQPLFDVIAQALARDGKFRGDVQSRAKTGEVRDVELVAFSIKDARGTVIAHVGIKRDITARKNLERAKTAAQG